MRIRRYTGKDVQEAMLKVKMDLGSEAIILSTRKFRRKGVKGLFSKPLTEVLAAVDDELGVKKKASVQQEVKKPNGETDRIELLEHRLSRMESMLSSIYSDVQQKEDLKFATNVLSESKKEESNHILKMNDFAAKPADGSFSLFTKRLADSDIEPEIIDLLVDKTKQFVRNYDSYDEIITVAEKIITSMLGQPQTINFREDGKPTVVMFLGPTGVGKTTTLAKIAADYSLNHHKKIAFVTADTYRIAAVEQLKTYAEILNIPVSIVYTPQEIRDAIEEYKDMDLVLIDTAGRSHKNKIQFSELKMLVNATEADEVYLVLSCSLGRSACRDILSHYTFLKDYKLLFTKIDEAHSPGIILNARYTTGKPLSYITVGQSVPDDIEVANVENIVKSILVSNSD